MTVICFTSLHSDAGVNVGYINLALRLSIKREK